MSAAQHTTLSVEYREIPRFIGYRFGSDGSVWTCWKRESRGPGNGQGLGFGIIGDIWKPLRLQVCKRTGYQTISLREDGRIKRTLYLVHRLILEAFVGPCPEAMEACHNDGTRVNNNIENLRWDTLSRNQLDRIQHGTAIRGDRHPMGKLKEFQIHEIDRLSRQGMSREDIADIYGVTSGNICRVLRRGIWKHVPVELI